MQQNINLKIFILNLNYMFTQAKQVLMYQTFKEY